MKWNVKGWKKNVTFGKRDDMIILVAEATKAVEEAFADNVTGGVFTPPFWVTAGYSISLCPADALCLCVELSWSFVAVAVAFAARTVRRGSHGNSWGRKSEEPKSKSFLDIVQAITSKF